MLDRRGMLKGLIGTACSAAAYPLMNSVTLAQGATLGDKRLVVIILRGAMDGLDAVRPVGDRDFAAHRPRLAAESAHDLDGFFALADPLAGLMPLWRTGELAFVHATSTPYRDQRSHFSGQELLEAGTDMGSAIRDGWLNRMLGAVPGLSAQTAYAVGREALPLLKGDTPALGWSPDMRLQLSSQNRALLEEIYHDDPLFRDSGREAMDLAERLVAGEAPGGRHAEIDAIVNFATARLREETRIAAFSISGWDTHRQQVNTMRQPYAQLERAILGLRDGLGPEWGKTVVLALTEFGRTVRENGSLGTDHGTAGVAVMAGGALKGGRVLGGWPGLAEADLYDRRDLLPLTDVRDWAAWTMRGLYGFDQGVLERTIFPGLRMGADPGILL